MQTKATSGNPPRAVERTVGSPWGPSGRRKFLKLAAAGAAALGLTSGLGGCVLTARGRRRLDFRDDFGVLNYAYALETLESKFYECVLASPPPGLRIPLPNRFQLRTDVRDAIVFNSRAGAGGRERTAHNLEVQAALGITF